MTVYVYFRIVKSAFIPIEVNSVVGLCSIQYASPSITRTPGEAAEGWGEVSFLIKAYICLNLNTCTYRYLDIYIFPFLYLRA